MSAPNNQLVPPFIAEPPIYDDLIGGDKEMNPSWVDWFNSITRVMGYCIIHDFIVSTANKTRQDVALLQATTMTTADRNNLENARVGTIIYNSTSNQFEFRIAGSPNQWVTFTPVPA